MTRSLILYCLLISPTQSVLLNGVKTDAKGCMRFYLPDGDDQKIFRQTHVPNDVTDQSCSEYVVNGM